MQQPCAARIARAGQAGRGLLVLPRPRHRAGGTPTRASHASCSARLRYRADACADARAAKRQGATLAESNANLDKIVALAEQLQGAWPLRWCGGAIELNIRAESGPSRARPRRSGLRHREAAVGHGGAVQARAVHARRGDVAAGGCVCALGCAGQEGHGGHTAPGRRGVRLLGWPRRVRTHAPMRSSR
jgi:hypothetical protein